MSRITVVFQEPKETYNREQQFQQKLTLEQMKEQLNTTFQETIKQESQRFAWFNNQYGGC